MSYKSIWQRLKRASSCEDYEDYQYEHVVCTHRDEGCFGQITFEKSLKDYAKQKFKCPTCGSSMVKVKYRYIGKYYDALS